MKHTLFTTLTLLSSTLCAQPGTLDNSFGSGGKLSTAFNAKPDHMNAVAAAPGRIVAVGTATDDNGYKAIAISCYHEDGTLDNSFDSDGKLLSSVSSGDDFSVAVKIQADGKIVVAGYCSSPSGYGDAFVARYNTDGTFDNTFGTGGFTVKSLAPTDDAAFDLLIQPDGKILLGGYTFSSSRGYFMLLRYNSDGSPDNSFGDDGMQSIAIGSMADIIQQMALQPDGKILAEGISFTGPYTKAIVLARFNADGSADNSFGAGGKVSTTIKNNSPFDYASSVALYSDNSFLVSGYAYNGTNTEFITLKYKANGTLDNSFAAGGRLTTAVGPKSAYACRVIILSEKRFLLGGYCNGNAGNDFCLVQYKSDGSLDSSFGTDGKTITEIDGDETASAMIVQDGKIIIGGSAKYGDTTHFYLQRYNGSTNLGMDHLFVSKQSLSAYPNPVKDQLCLQYKLQGAETVSISLTDVQGRTVAVFIEKEKQEAGDYSKLLTLPAELPAGVYMVKISNGKVQNAVKILKN